MADVVVCLPKSFSFLGKVGIEAWCSEGDAAGEPDSNREYEWSLGRIPPRIRSGERIYVMYKGIIRGYAPLKYIDDDCGQVVLVRGGGAVACTISGRFKSFRGFRYRWWDRAEEVPFSDWRNEDAEPVVIPMGQAMDGGP